MLKFFKDSFREIKHVVWPTKQETKKYFLIIVVFLIIFGLYVFAASSLFSEVILYLRNILN